MDLVDSAPPLASSVLWSIFDDAPAAMLLVDAQGRLHAANQAARRLFGGRPTRNHVDLLLDACAASSSGPASSPQATQEWRPAPALSVDGRTLDVEVRGRALSSEERPLFALEVRERRSRLAGDQARMRLDALVRSSQDAIIGEGLDGTILSWNAAAERMFGYTEDEIVGKAISQLIPPTRSSEEDELLDEIRRGAAVEHYETQRMRKDGSLIDVSLSLSPVLDESGTVVGAAKIARDITRRRRQEAALERHREALARSNAALEQFAYVASHDLQEPLRMVASYTQLLQRRYQGQLDADADEFIGYAVDGARRMQTLIQDLLAYSRVKTQLEKPQPCSTQDCLDRALRNLQASIRESGASVHAEALPTLVANPIQIAQLFHNLVGNAIKFRRGPNPNIHIDAVREDARWHFRVRDDGIGIDPQFAERIFGIFQRLHGVGAFPGTGIGLAICREIVEQHRGRIWVESQPGQGATFHFTLPDHEEDPYATP